MMGAAFFLHYYNRRCSRLPCVDLKIQRLLSWLHGEVFESVTDEKVLRDALIAFHSLFRHGLQGLHS